MQRRTFALGTTAIGAHLLLQGCGGAELAKLSAKQAAVDKLASDFLAQYKVPALSVALLNTRESIASAQGVRVIGQTAKVQISDVFHLGSNTKSMLAMLIMRSVELGELRLESPIYDLIPKLRTTGLAAYAGVTLEQLLSHRTGIEPLLVTEDIDNVLPVFEGSASSQRQQALSFLTTREPVALPGGSFVYSNGGYAVAAAVLEATTGKSYEQLIQERLFAPLGIEATIGWPGQARPDAPYGHFYSGSAFTPIAPDAPIAQFRPALTPAGNISMNILNYSKYLQAHLAALKGEVARCLSFASYQRMHKAIPGTEFGYALGWATDGKDKQGKQADWHYGSTDIFGCYAVLQPAKNRAVGILVNGEIPSFDEPLSKLAYAILALTD